MRHGQAGNRLSRNRSLLSATLRDMAKAALIQQRIRTTEAKAKEARKLVDHLITLGKKGTLADKRRAFAILCDHGVVSDLFNKTAPLFKNRAGGYTRLIKLGLRRGDNAKLVYLELTEKRPEEIKAKKAKKGAQTVEDAQIVDEKAVAGEKETTKTGRAAVKNVPEKATPVKKAVGGIRKMFDRKSSGDK